MEKNQQSQEEERPSPVPIPDHLSCLKLLREATSLSDQDQAELSGLTENNNHSEAIKKPKQESAQTDEEHAPASPLRPITEEPSFDDDNQHFRTAQKSKHGILKTKMREGYIETLKEQNPIQFGTPDFKVKPMSGIKPLALSNLMTTQQMMLFGGMPGAQTKGSGEVRGSPIENLWNNNDGPESHNPNRKIFLERDSAIFFRTGFWRRICGALRNLL
jgi:hypothetical protein